MIFKIENPEEQELCGIREDVEFGRTILDPFEDGSLCDLWLDLGILLGLRCAQRLPTVPRIFG